VKKQKAVQGPAAPGTCRRTSCPGFLIRRGPPPRQKPSPLKIEAAEMAGDIDNFADEKIIL